MTLKNPEFINYITIIKEAANNADLNPGVYKMINADSKVIYVGKAKHLKNRLMSYTRFDQMPNRLKMMVSNIARIEFIVVKSELEALLLENNLIKQLKPFYNILLKDDKTFPYLVIDTNHDFPRVYKYRTLKAKGPNFYGPYPAISSLDETLKVIQKIFLLRNCTDNYFNQRTRPCLQYFIKRCSGPCCDKISKEEYSKNLEFAKNLLNGKDEIARKALVSEMNDASQNMDFEKAALIRDRIKAISEIQSKQYIQIDNLSSIDFIAVAKGSKESVIAMSFFRAGKNVGTETFVIQNSFENDEESYIIESFITQFYKGTNPPSLIVTSHNLESQEKIEEFLKKDSGIKTTIIFGSNGTLKKIVDSCQNNANIKLSACGFNQYDSQISKLCEMLDLKSINRIETYDNSHIQGTNACGVMIVFENGNIQKNKARKFNIDDKIANGGDDIAMMKFSLEKRFKSKNIPEVPDLIIIDGGKTQLSAAIEVIKNFENLRDKVKVIGIAKQNDRKVGDEKIIFENGDEKILGHGSELLNFLIMLRNESHKTAIMFHRKKRQKALSKSQLDDIPNIGPSRKRKLLEHFGSVDFIKNISIDDLKMVKGIDSKTAELIFEFFNNKK